MSVQHQVDEIVACRPVLPFRSTTADGLSGVTVARDGDAVVIDGLKHKPTDALELCGAIGRAVAEIAGSRIPNNREEVPQ